MGATLHPFMNGLQITELVPPVDLFSEYLYFSSFSDASDAWKHKGLHPHRGLAGVINCGTGEGVTVRQVADTLAALLGRTGLVHEQMPPKPDPLGSVIADAGRLKSRGWKPQVDLREGLVGPIRAYGLKIAAPVL